MDLYGPSPVQGIGKYGVHDAVTVIELEAESRHTPRNQTRQVVQVNVCDAVSAAVTLQAVVLL
jgi:hypothetical protein